MKKYNYYCFEYLSEGLLKNPRMGEARTYDEYESGDTVVIEKEGRGIFNNIKKTLLFLLSSNFGEVLVMLIAILLNLPIPLIAIHILWVNLLTDTLPSLALGQDNVDDSVMKEKPRNINESIFANKGWLIVIG